ncbi:conserved hypothetical protein [Neospora caninum Liverpool]|uniref:Hus1-like protein n=1 Tax=Neospora caninum (strain Liverpool) TaxID=572307 RepID=F0VAX4_NEOCL|nr:conserved hypothetical protein [Neospora caninum Liverpool]CBZ51350.1 conserved hypothetical protein [Neospora caninum Liverpool]CEL68668.1 TPA: hypothetical protein BN1204_044150 [Neospora caninum Liverpool]|eukprot:XP_003881383.1 conserved hypothetical protein [Neospora caninum Liverpool]
MKFKASLRLDTLQYLLGATAALARMAKIGAASRSTSSALGAPICYLKLTPSQVFLNVRHCDEMEAYVEAEARALFHPGWVIESKRQNNIGLVVDILHLHNTLKLASHCSRITMKLAKRQGQGVLSFDFTDALMENLWITQDCPVQTLQGEDVDTAGTPDIPACEWNVEAPRLRLVLSVLDRMSRLKAESVMVDVTPSAADDGLCELTFIGEQPTEPRVSRCFKTRRLAAALRVALDMAHGRSNDGLVACVIPEDEHSYPWACVVFHSSKRVDRENRRCGVADSHMIFVFAPSGRTSHA